MRVVRVGERQDDVAVRRMLEISDAGGRLDFDRTDPYAGWAARIVDPRTGTTYTSGRCDAPAVAFGQLLDVLGDDRHWRSPS